MKVIIITLLVISFLWQGCHSYRDIEKIQISKLNELDNEDIKLTLKNGRIIESNQLMHGAVNRPSHFVFGIALNITTNEMFSGRIDFSKIEKITKNKKNYTQYILKNGQLIHFINNYYKTILPNDGRGFWLINKNDSTNTLIFEFISIEDIKDVETLKFDYVETTAIVLGSIGIMIAAFAAAYSSSKFIFKGRGSGFPF